MTNLHPADRAALDLRAECERLRRRLNLTEAENRRLRATATAAELFPVILSSLPDGIRDEQIVARNIAIAIDLYLRAALNGMPTRRN